MVIIELGEDMEKLNNKGYLLVEIIVAIVLALGIAYFLMNLTIKFSKTDEDIYQSITWTNDKNIITNMIMEDVENYNLISVTKINDYSVSFKFSDNNVGDNGIKKLVIDIDKKMVCYGDYEKEFDNALEVSEVEISIKDGYTSVKVPMISKYSDEDYGVKLFVEEGIKYLYDIVASNSVVDDIASDFVTSSTGVNFSTMSSNTNGKGVYTFASSVNNSYPIYYYRGAVENNNILFAGFCWKIVRTTETGGVKLIYNGISTNGICNNTGTSSQIGTSSFNNINDGIVEEAYVGYMYGTLGASTYEDTHKNTNDSIVKIAIDTWYENNMTSYTNKLEDTIWCNDRTVVAPSDIIETGNKKNIEYNRVFLVKNPSLVVWNGIEVFFGAYYRVISTQSPSLVCSQGNDKFTVDIANGNGKLKYPVGLITADEIMLAGGIDLSKKEIDTNINYYLYTGNDYWAGSPSFLSNVIGSVPYVGEYFVNSDGFLSDGFFEEYNVDEELGIRPVISLKSNTIVESGDGTSKNPYVIN